MADTHRIRIAFRTAGILLASVVVIGVLFRLTEAGSLAPAAAPSADSMPSLASISDALVGSSFDSSGIASDSNGSALEIAKCIIGRLAGKPPCP